MLCGVLSSVVWSHGLTARTPACHAGSEGSIPSGTAKNWKGARKVKYVVSPDTRFYV